MMLKYYILIIFLGLFTNLIGQQSVCVNDTVKLYTGQYRGERFWQQSPDGVDWSRMADRDSDTLVVVAMENQEYRFEILEGSCQSIFSNSVEILVNQPPVVVLQSIDSVCLNADPINLTTGTPVGGNYYGTGIMDGRFIPNLAGVGTHIYSYAFTEPSTECADTSSATIQVMPLTTAPLAGTDQLEIMQDSIQLNGNLPDVGQGYWTIVSGIGGTFSDSTQSDSWFFKGTEDLAYTLAWHIEGKCGSASDEVNLLFLRLSKNPCPGTPVVFDADGTMYPTIQIGDQCWMAENLKVGTFITSTETGSAHSDAADNGIIEKYCFDNDENNCELYGGLYDWDEMMGYSTTVGSQGICPEGWHIPDNEDWLELDDFYKYNDAGLHLKEGGESGFEGLLSGDRHNQGFFVSFGSSGFYWSSDTYNYNNANEGYVRELCACNNLLERLHFNKKTGASVRCIKNE